MRHLYEKFIFEYYRREFPQITTSASHIRWAADDGFDFVLPITLEHEGKIQTMKMWAEELGIPYQLVRDRHKENPSLSFEELFKPAQENIKIKYKGKEQDISTWAKELGIPIGTIYNRIYRYGMNKPNKILNKSNERKQTLITYKGKTMNLREWSDELNLPYSLVKGRHHRHPEYTPEQLFAPKKR